MIRLKKPDLLILPIVWVAVTGAFYYRQIWRVITEGLGRWPLLDGFRDASVPYFGEAVRSAATSLAGAAILLAAAMAVGLTMVRLVRWELDAAAERLPVAASIGIGVLAYVGFVLASVGAYRPSVLRAFVVTIIVAWVVYTLARKQSWRIKQRSLPRVGGADRVWLGITALALAFSLYGALAPVIDYDAVWYHLHFPNVFLAHGRLVDLPGEYVSLYPMMWELWFGYGLAFGGASTATLLHFATLPLTGMVVFALTRRYATPASPWLAVALFVTVPTVLWEGTTAYVDLAFTLHVSVALLALLRYYEIGNARWLALAAFELGCALATKHVGLIVLAIMCAGVAVARWHRDRRIWAALRISTALGVASLVVPLAWYARAWYLTGDPMFPELFSIFGAPPDRWDAQARAGLERYFASFGRTRTFLHQMTLPWDMTMHSERYGGALGPLFLALVPFAALRLLRKTDGGVRGDVRSVSALTMSTIFTLAYLVLWASPIASFQMRWILAVTPVLAVLAAAGYERASALASTSAWPVTRTLGVLTVVLLALDLPPFTPLHEHERRAWNDSTGWLTHVVHGLPVVVLGAESREGYVRRQVPTYPAWEVARRTLKPSDKVLTWSGGDHFYAIESRIWVFSPAVRAAAAAPAGEERAAFESLRRLGITHILIEKRFLRTNGYDPSLTWESFALTNPRTVTADYEPLYEDERVVLYRIRWEGSRTETSAEQAVLSARSRG